VFDFHGSLWIGVSIELSVVFQPKSIRPKVIFKIYLPLSWIQFRGDILILRFRSGFLEKFRFIERLFLIVFPARTAFANPNRFQLFINSGVSAILWHWTKDVASEMRYRA
jgi:hypothetical protein